MGTGSERPARGLHLQRDRWLVATACGATRTYDALYAQQTLAKTPQERKAIVDQMQQMFYEQAPYHILYYDDNLHAYRTDKYAGWAEPAGRWHAVVRVRHARLHPADRCHRPRRARPWPRRRRPGSPTAPSGGATPTPSTGTGGSPGTSSGGLPIVPIVIVIVVVAAVGGYLGDAAGMQPKAGGADDDDE